jgi:transglutaminase-like putative cysteine protease
MMCTRRLRVQHDTEYLHDLPVEQAHHVAFLIPRDTPLQRVTAWHTRIDPRPDGWTSSTWEAARQLSRDAWGNARLVFSHARVHQRLAVSSQFEVVLRAGVPIDPNASPKWETVAEQLRYHAPDDEADDPVPVEFSLASPFATPDAQLAAYGRAAFLPGVSLAGGALHLMQQINRDFRYMPLATSVGTRAAEALQLRQGVCQDFAQVMVAACRALGLSARYVSGYLLTQPPPGQARLIGADASHAWAEVWCPNQGWLALDPTNNMPAGLDHVVLAWGRDYADVAPLRGVIRGGGGALPRVAVTVEPV